MTQFWKCFYCRRALPALAYIFFISIPITFAANIGTVVPIIGQVADVTYDSQRNLVYLANAGAGQVEVYSPGARALLNPIQTGLQPVSLALSPDLRTLYVANAGSLSVSAIDLNSQQVVANYTTGTARPDAVAVGADGLVLILGPSGLSRLDPTSGLITVLPVAVPATPPAGLPNIPASAVPSGFRAGMVTSASGSLIVGLSTNRLFVYDVASGTVLRSRNVTGLLAILSISPDGTRFMAGPFLFDTQTMAILGRAGTPAATLTGGSAFSIDGNTVYGTFSTQPPINPLNTNNPQNTGGATLPGGGTIGQSPTQGVLQLMRASSLTPILGLRLAETVNPKIVASPDGQFLFAVTTSGLTVIPIGQLNQLPILAVDTANVVLTVNICNRTQATAQIQIRNQGAGRLTFTAAAANAAAPVIIGQRAGLAPSVLQVTFDPRSVTTAAAGTQQVAIVLVSPEAVNIEPAILVNLNFRDTTQRGTIVPINGVATSLQLDPSRQRLYISNYTQDQIEVFSIPDQSFLPPIRVGNRPLAMAMAGPSTLVVANSGAERISVVDLDQMQEVQTIAMGPIPLNATPLFPRSIAASTNAILFTAIPLPALGAAPANTGSIWQLSLLTGTAFPRLNLGPGVTNTIQGRTVLTAPANGSAIVSFEFNGTLRLYDPLSDAFAITRTAAVTGFRGTASASDDGNIFLMDDTVFNRALGFQGRMTPGGVTASNTFGVAAAGGNALRIQPGTTAAPTQMLQLFNLTTFQIQQQFPMPEAAMDITPAAATAAVTTRVWPPRPVALEIGVTGQTQLLPHGMVVDGSNNAYLLTVSGLSIVSLASSGGRTPSFNASGVVNGASFMPQISAGGLITIFGSNLADNDSAPGVPLPTVLGGVCVTANELPIPLLYTSPTQINAQLPPNVTGRVTLAVRSPTLGLASAGVQVNVTATAPGVFTTNVDGQTRALLFHSNDFSFVTPDHPAHRDEVLILYATGLGPVNPSVQAGMPAPSNPPSSTTQDITVAIGGHQFDLQFAGLAPGFVGAYQLNIYVPGDRLQGDNLPVVITAGGATSTAANPPLAAIH